MSDLIERLQNQMSEELNDEAVAELARLTAEVERLRARFGRSWPQLAAIPDRSRPLAAL